MFTHVKFILFRSQTQKTVVVTLRNQFYFSKVLIYNIMSDLYLIVDLYMYSWINTNIDTGLIINNLLVLINTHLLLSYNNRVILVNNLQVLVINKENREQINTDLFKLKEKQTMARDIGLALALINVQNRREGLDRNYESNKDTNEKTVLRSNIRASSIRIVVISLSKECKEDYLLYLKSAFVARRFRNEMNRSSQTFDISIFSFYKNFALFELGNFFMDYKLVNLLSIFTGIKQERLVLSQARCICHNKIILYGMVCPICLTVYCKQMAICQKCKARFNFKRALKRT